MSKAILDKNHIATQAGNVIVYNYDGVTREYISFTDEYLAVGVGIPANSTIDKPLEEKEGFAVCRKTDDSGWIYIADHRGEAVYSTENGEAIEITVPGDYPDDTTTTAPSTPYDAWDGKKWVTDTDAQQADAIAEAELQRQQLISAAMQSISVIQLKLQAGRALSDAEKNKLNATLDYIDEVTATDTETAPDINWPVPPEA
ncbi:tail fiber assembly protein [Citrobacter farmeri]